jgi:hypothetical protein
VKLTFSHLGQRILDLLEIWTTACTGGTWLSLSSLIGLTLIHVSARLPGMPTCSLLNRPVVFQLELPCELLIQVQLRRAAHRMLRDPGRLAKRETTHYFDLGNTYLMVLRRDIARIAHPEQYVHRGILIAVNGVQDTL